MLAKNLRSNQILAKFVISSQSYSAFPKLKGLKLPEWWHWISKVFQIQKGWYARLLVSDAVLLRSNAKLFESHATPLGSDAMLLGFSCITTLTSEYVKS